MFTCIHTKIRDLDTQNMNHIEQDQRFETQYKQSIEWL